MKPRGVVPNTESHPPDKEPAGNQPLVSLRRLSLIEEAVESEAKRFATDAYQEEPALTMHTVKLSYSKLIVELVHVRRMCAKTPLLLALAPVPTSPIDRLPQELEVLVRTTQRGQVLGHSNPASVFTSPFDNRKSASVV